MKKSHLECSPVQEPKDYFYAELKTQSDFWKRHINAGVVFLLREAHQLIAVSAYSRGIELCHESLPKGGRSALPASTAKKISRLREISAEGLELCSDLSHIEVDIEIFQARCLSMQIEIEGILDLLLKQFPSLKSRLSIRLQTGIELLLGCYTDRSPGCDTRRSFGFFGQMPYATASEETTDLVFRHAIGWAMRKPTTTEERCIALTVALALLVCPQKVRLYLDRGMNAAYVRYEHWADGNHMLVFMQGNGHISAGRLTKGLDEGGGMLISARTGYPALRLNNHPRIRKDLIALWPYADSTIARAAVLGMALADIIGEDVIRMSNENTADSLDDVSFACAAHDLYLKIENGKVLQARYPGLEDAPCRSTVWDTAMQRDLNAYLAGIEESDRLPLAQAMQFLYDSSHTVIRKPVSALQRHLKLGYNQGLRIAQHLECLRLWTIYDDGCHGRVAMLRDYFSAIDTE